MNNEKLNEIVNSLYEKINSGELARDNIEYHIYMWLSELLSRREYEESVSEIVKLIKGQKYILIRQYKKGKFINEEMLEIDEVAYSEYARKKVEEIRYSIELEKSCEAIIQVIPILIIKEY